MDDLHQDSQTGLPTEYFALCSEHFEASCFSRSVLIGTPVDFKRFYLEKGSYMQSRKIHWTLITQEMREDLQIDFFLTNILWTFVSDPTKNHQYPKSPPQKNIDFFWIG